MSSNLAIPIKTKKDSLTESFLFYPEIALMRTHEVSSTKSRHERSE